MKLSEKEIEKRINENEVVKSLQKSIAQKDKQIFKEEKKIIEVLKDIKSSRIDDDMGFYNKVLINMCRAVVKMADERQKLIIEISREKELFEKWVGAIESLLGK